MKLDKSHIKLIKKILNSKEYYSTSNKEDDMLVYLSKNNLIYPKYDINEYGESSNLRYIISEDGKAYLYERKQSMFGKWIPYIITTSISVIALIISIIALTK